VTSLLSATAFQVRSSKCPGTGGQTNHRKKVEGGKQFSSFRKYLNAGKRGSENFKWGGLLVREGFYGPTAVHKQGRGLFNMSGFMVMSAKEIAYYAF
jgi:hypothetical protein